MHWKDRTPGAPIAPTPITGSIEKDAATLAFNEEHRELVQGMAVTGPGLNNAETEKGPHQERDRKRNVQDAPSDR